jgi:hypothetical protein
MERNIPPFFTDEINKNRQGILRTIRPDLRQDIKQEASIKVAVGRKIVSA